MMATHAPGAVAADSDQQALWRKLDYFPTPPWAARAGGELVNLIDPWSGGLPPHPARPEGGESPSPGRGGMGWYAWEPACGEGHMAAALRPYFAAVHASDIHDHPGGERHGPPLDFLSPAADRIDGADWIITNPPFGLAAEFVAAGLRRARRGVAILARTSFFSAATRFELFFRPEQRLYAFAPFFERPGMVLGQWDPKASTATDYAWFVWMQPGAAADMSFQTRRLLSLRPEIWPITPGTRARLTQPDDARLWGVKADAPLFDAASGSEGRSASLPQRRQGAERQIYSGSLEDVNGRLA